MRIEVKALGFSAGGRRILNGVSAALDTQTVTNLNARVDIDKEEYEDVAEAFFETLE